ncbi:syntaxin [Thelephora ganbajun]|uniref:Syntaxin n=1 Tax=Thelephora ganbajun TaxID=370292 RepID=A0ACB6ZLL6_THEGA|nr:syntaxin [Thelephora ganbajun]
MTSAIQAIHIPAYEERTDPSPHTVYRIQITANVREWPMWRRYTEFVDLHTELTKSTGSPPPVALPPKHSFSMFRSHSNPTILEQRRIGLETYLRAILSAKEDKWRECYAFKQFLGIPIGKNTAIESRLATTSSSKTFTLVSWLDEHTELQSTVRDIRADINKRDTLSDRGDIPGSHQSNVQAKKKLITAQTRVDALDDSLKTHAMAGMSEGELQRRTEMVARLRDDCDKLTKMVTVARHTSRGLGSTFERNPAPDSDRNALLGKGLGTFSKPGRVFGTPPPPQETEETRPLDANGLLQLQQAKIDDQDTNLAQLSAILQRQKHLGLAINAEVNQHIEMLDQLDQDMDRFGNKLGAAKKQMNRLG